MAEVMDESNKKAYPGFRIDRAMNGWVLYETSPEYDERRRYIASDITELTKVFLDRIEHLEGELEAGLIHTSKS